MLHETGEKSVEIATAAMQIVEDTALVVDAIARTRDSLDLPEKRKKAQDRMAAYLLNHLDEIPLTNPRLRLPPDILVQRNWVGAEIDNEFLALELVLMGEKQDERLSELLVGRQVRVTPHEGVNPKSVIHAPEGVEIPHSVVGQVAKVSALTGNLIVNSLQGDIPYSVYLLGDSEEARSEPSIKADLHVEPNE